MTLKLILYILVLVCTTPYFSEGQTPCITANDLRLSSTSSFTSTNNTGRLEICYCPSNGGNCTWATISAGSLTTPWSWKNVQVACRDLSINTGLGNPILQSTVRPADVALSSISIYPSTFSCDGTETKLSDCIILSIPTDSNVHSADVFINCLSTIPSGSLRLTGSTTRHRGVLEIYRSGIWQTFCPTGFDTVDANVVCQTLGYSSGIVRSFPKTGYRGNEISLSPVITGVSCRTGMTDFDSCTSQRGSCSSTNLAGVTCTANSSTAGTIRLFSVSTSSTYDRVEILYAGRWGTVCDNQWSITDGRVACRGLGYDVDDTGVSTSFTAPSSSQRPIWVSGYTCSGSESRLNTCTNAYPIGYAPSCSHSQDAGLFCDSNDEGGGLSGGAIAGIVIGSLVGAGIFIGFITHLHKKEQAKKAAAARAAATATAQPPPNNVTAVTTTVAHNENTNETPQSRRSSSSSDSSSARVTDNQKDTELRRAPPPSYNEALELKQVNPRPNELEEKQHPEELINPHVPYPVSPHTPDLVYPPPQPSYGFVAAGYPPPTQYPLSYGYGAPPNPYPGYYPPPVGDMAVPGPTSQFTTTDPSAPPPNYN